MLALHIGAMVIGFVMFLISAAKSVSLWRDSKDPLRPGKRTIERLNKRMKKLEVDATRNIKEIETVQRDRMRVRLDTVAKLREQKGMSDAEIEQAFKDLY